MVEIKNVVFKNDGIEGGPWRRSIEEEDWLRRRSIGGGGVRELWMTLNASFKKFNL